MTPNFHQFCKLDANEEYDYVYDYMNNDISRRPFQESITIIKPLKETREMFVCIRGVKKEIISSWVFLLMNISKEFCLHHFQFDEVGSDHYQRGGVLFAEAKLRIPLDTVPFDKVIQTISQFHPEGYWKYYYTGFP